MQQKQCYEFVHGLKTIVDKALELSCAVPAQTDSELHGKLTQMSAVATQPDSPATALFTCWMMLQKETFPVRRTSKLSGIIIVARRKSIPSKMQW